MTYEHSMFKSLIDGFFLRLELYPEDGRDCFDLVKGLYPDRAVSPASSQGYCSMTLFVGDDTVVQFRPHAYRLDLSITDAARAVYNEFAPETQYITTLPSSGLLVYSMTRIAGVPFKDFRASSRLACSTHYPASLCKDLAVFLSQAWHQSGRGNLPLGRVGKSLVSRLKSLSTDLPVRFQPRASHILRHIRQIEALPWVLTHGDIAAANIMVDQSTGRLNGLVDWAEAERLPFGVCFYGLEEILGESRTSGFHFHPNAVELRVLFWSELRKLIPELQQTKTFEAVKLSRDLGILLWHGIAFDNGAIDRVVQEDRDVEEIHRLDAFFGLQDQPNVDSFTKI